ncbi:P-loop containing nucleoside triphosphate hydrolase protein [Pluteus cervinus]|uniref:P-loop containing nucleoside triphosphate hydrolase protein n=1 Tax=Pluteus cervinus TaxID=181527 RepID=A0ACD3B6E0_9AGAR|nr:P-loop containing nucleoside triphosphate hydrolase protein [Pluteus cervinus]
MIWEVAGESASGKTQFALQLSLFVQLQRELGGLAGSVCYLPTSSSLPTTRLLQIARSHPLLRSSNVGLEHIDTISIPTITVLLKVLSQVFPSHAKSKMQDADAKPVKLLVIDALAELFHTSEQTTTAVLVERSHNITEISTLLHGLANTFQLAVVVLNEVTDAFTYASSTLQNDQDLLIYNQQSQWFSRADSVPGENRKEVALGLVWSNQVNARILLSRTGRRRYIEGPEVVANKRPRLDPSISSTSTPLTSGAQADDQLALVRRLTVIFSSISRPVSLDYVVEEGGISVIPDDDIAQIPPLDVGSIEALRAQEVGDDSEGTEDVAPIEEDEWDAYWRNNELADEVIGTLRD